jgi:transposase, IS5 family
MLGNTIERIITDAGYRGHNPPPEHQFKVYTAGQKRRVTPQTPRHRRAGNRPSQGKPQNGPQLSGHSTGDAINVVLAVVGYNFRLLLRWLRLLLSYILLALLAPTHLKLA